MKPVVSAIYGFEPQRENEFQIGYMVGHVHRGGEHDGLTITAIEYEEHNYGDHGLGWYAVKSGDVLIVEVQARAVAEVHYKKADAA